MIFGLFVCGLLSGVTTWLFGFGGGFVTVPLLYLLLSHQGAVGGQAMQIAVATSALVMLCTSLLASGRHLRAGTVHWRSLLPILGGIAIGGIAGAALALRVNGEWIRWLFILYLAVTIVDCYARPGFMAPSTACAPSSAGARDYSWRRDWPDCRLPWRWRQRDDRTADAPAWRDDGAGRGNGQPTDPAAGGDRQPDVAADGADGGAALRFHR